MPDVSPWLSFVDRYGLPLVLLFGMLAVGWWVLRQVLRENGPVDRVSTATVAYITASHALNEKTAALTEKATTLQEVALKNQEMTLANQDKILATQSAALLNHQKLIAMEEKNQEQCGVCEEEMTAISASEVRLHRAADRACDLLEVVCPLHKPHVDAIRQELRAK